MLSSPSAERNKVPILEVLKTFITEESKIKSVLELASGTGAHVSYFAQHFPQIVFQPSEIDPRSLDSIRAHIRHFGVSCNVREPVRIDLGAPQLYEATQTFDMVFPSNFTHISPLLCTYGAFDIASRSLRSKDFFLIYGPFSIDGKIFPESNQNFDESLRNRNAEWGYRDTSLLMKICEESGFCFDQKIAMPSNNWIMVFKKL